MRLAVLAIGFVAACDGASARFALSNTTSARVDHVLADGTSLRLKIIAAYLAEDVDPVTMNNLGRSEMIWLNPQCGGDISGCNVDGFTLPDGPRITDYFDLSRPSAEVNADLNAQDLTVAPGSYRYARVELCKAYGGQSQASVPTMMWAGPGMTAEQPFTSGDCGRTSLAFEPPLVLVAGDAVEITLGYDLATSIMTGAPGPGTSLAGVTHEFRACSDIDADHRACMDFPDFAPSASKL
jgi:hypothetical protein